MEKGLNYLIVENQGVGYKVFAVPEIFEKKLGEKISIFTYHKIAEDGQALFGLPDFQTLQFFEQLLSVSGVGPKSALALVSSAPIDTIKQAILSQDAGMFRKVSGIGTKTAEKIIVELKDKLVVSRSDNQSISASGEVFDALLALGYKQSDVRSIIGRLDGSQSQGEQIKQALKLLGK